jgi:wyosine [tRNA(Phe)-imidazoG37] synthetase (radical SAM superfamily)
LSHVAKFKEREVTAEIAFSPVPSRRLGRSLGINNIPPKHCSYGYRYCQVGPTHDKLIVPRPFYTPEAIAEAVTRHVALAREQNEPIDYLTFVPDGEPTLDSRLGESIRALRTLGIPIAVISNASLLWREAVRDALAPADWVSVKVDSVDEPIWRQVNRPHPELTMGQVLNGIEHFARSYRGTLVSETMLLAGVNDGEAAVEQLAAFLQRLPLACAYLAVPTRPTAEADAHAPDETVLLRAFQQLSARLQRVELLIGYEGDAFASTGDITEDLLSITAVHPLRESAVKELLQRSQGDWSQIQALLDSGKLRQVQYQGERFYTRSPAFR